MSISFSVDDREFTKTLARYRAYCTSRTLPEIINTKAFFIARRAVVETPKAATKEIRKFIDARGGEIVGKIINKRRGARGEKGLYGEAMTVAIGLVKAARLRSVAFLKSGWLPAIKVLEKRVEMKWRRGAARNDKAAKIVGRDKGEATPARQGWKVFAEIVNAANANRDTRTALIKEGFPALQRAFAHEVRSMKEYIEKKMREDAKIVGIKT